MYVIGICLPSTMAISYRETIIFGNSAFIVLSCFKDVMTHNTVRVFCETLAYSYVHMWNSEYISTSRLLTHKNFLL